MNSMSHQVRTDVAVVGGGIAGLVAAALARRDGQQVVVIDPAPLGGRGRTDERGGFLFNRGPHAVYLGGPADRTLRGLGCDLAGVPPSASVFGRLGDTVHPLPTSAGSLLRTPLLGTRGKVALARFQSRLKAAKPNTLADTTFADWLDAQHLPADARSLVEMLARVATYTNAPELASADMVVGQVQMAGAKGVRYLHGGWQTIVDHLARLAGTATAHHQATATAITRDGDDVVIECAGGSQVIARAAVVALADPHATARLLGRAPFHVGPPVEAACLDLGLQTPPPRGLLLGIDQPLYLSVHSPSARLAPAGRSVVHVARYLSPGETNEAERARTQLRDHAVHAGIAPEQIVEERFLHRMTVVGAMATAATGGLPGRPRTHDSGIAGLFLAGDWVGPTGHLLDASVASAAEASAAACRAATLVGR